MELEFINILIPIAIPLIGMISYPIILFFSIETETALLQPTKERFRYFLGFNLTGFVLIMIVIFISWDVSGASNLAMVFSVFIGVVGVVSSIMFTRKNFMKKPVIFVNNVPLLVDNIDKDDIVCYCFQNNQKLFYQFNKDLLRGKRIEFMHKEVFEERYMQKSNRRRRYD